jgi:hypothetical protein
MVDEAPAKKTCFIVGPIGEALSPVRQLADWLLKGVIKPVLEDDEFGYIVKRADHDTEPGSITSAVIDDLVNADLVVADLTGFNPNAFYELGIRHALRKPAIHMTAEFVKLPFDNADQRTIFVNIADFDSIEAAKSRLRSAVQAVNRDGYQVSNPVVQAAAVSALKESADPKDQIIAGLEERLSRLEQDKIPDKALRKLISEGRKADGTRFFVSSVDRPSAGESLESKLRSQFRFINDEELNRAKLTLLGSNWITSLTDSDESKAELVQRLKELNDKRDDEGGEGGA